MVNNLPYGSHDAERGEGHDREVFYPEIYS